MARRLTGSVRFHRGGYEGSILLQGRRHTVRSKSEEEVRAKLAGLRGHAQPVAALVSAAKEHDATGGLTLGDYLCEIWLPAVRSTLKPASYETYALLVEKRWVPALGTVPLTCLRAPAIQQLLFRWQRESSGGTVLNAYRCLHRALVTALRLGYIERHPCDAVEPPRVVRSRPELWTPEQVRYFLEKSQASEWHALWCLLLGTGCRKGEALALRWSNVDLDRGIVRFAESLCWRSGITPTIVRPKTEAGVRSVGLPSFAVEALRGLPRRVERVVSRPDGSTPSPFAIYRAFRRDVQRTELPDMRVHDLRHLSASLLLRQRVPLPLVSKRLGHAGPHVTARVYSHLLDQDDSPALQALERELGSIGGTNPPGGPTGVQLRAEEGGIAS